MAEWPVIPAIRSHDLARLLIFYTETLGFHLERGTAAEGHVSISFGPARLMLESVGDLYSPAYNAAISERSRGRAAMALYVEADDLEGLYKRVTGAGAVIADPLAPRDWGQREFTVEDADGNWLTFWQKLDG
ncbi:MAG: VOC family protein [Dehalococcoidia bacterium]|nr:VOC family protein [Dehalococcoidia bacterium]MCA9829992.1 VOC family protein [Dehalococcoidia bacterium]MCB9486797.1 VOC family protein [Thermoflexaceae bacterium]